MIPERIEILSEKLMNGSLAPHELEELNAWWAAHSDEELILDTEYNSAGALKKKIAAQIKQRIAAEEGAPVISMHRRRFIRIAASIAAAAVCVGIFIMLPHINKNSAAPALAIQQDIDPGSNKAILTLSNGKTIELNSNTSETFTDENLTIENTAGQLVYASLPIPSIGGVAPGGANSNLNSSGPGAGVGRGERMSNTMTTPRGGQYQLKLSDGTTVFLNAQSSITYPVNFSSKTREVSITGEAYFEIAQNAKQPFIVHLTDASRVQVLGTSFNINSYSDENTIRTTLIEGKIKVAKNNNEQVMAPGQQATMHNNEIIITRANTEQVMAWRNGWFNFDGADLKMVLRQLSRWYDVDVEFEGDISNEKFGGELDRSLKLSQVLKVLERSGVVFKIQGKKLIVARQ